MKITVNVLIMSVAILGNLAVVIVVARNKRMQTTTNYYLVNLAVSDLMVTLSCTWVHMVDDLTEGWILGAFFCKFNSFMQVLSLVSSVFTLSLIACDRFFGIVFAMKAHLTERKAHTFIIIIWICSIGISVPLLLYRKQESRTWLNHVELWCADVWPEVVRTDPVTGLPRATHPSRTFYYTFVSIVLYFFPILIMSFAYCFIILKLSQKPPGEYVDSDACVQIKVKRKVVFMLMIILTVFAFCWLPFQVAVLYSEHRSDQIGTLPPWYNGFQYFATLLAYANSAFNPVIYTCFNNNFRRAFKDTFCRRSRRAGYLAVKGGNNSFYSRNSTVATRTSVCLNKNSSSASTSL